MSSIESIELKLNSILEAIEKNTEAIEGNRELIIFNAKKLGINAKKIDNNAKKIDNSEKRLSIQIEDFKTDMQRCFNWLTIAMMENPTFMSGLNDDGRASLDALWRYSAKAA
jgi:hypothetical protein